MIELTVRLVFSLSVVLGLLFLCARLAGRRFQGRRNALVQVVHRQPIGRHASVSVVNVGGRILVLGTTDQEVRLLTELDPADIAEDDGDERLLTLVTRSDRDAAFEADRSGDQQRGLHRDLDRDRHSEVHRDLRRDLHVHSDSPAVVLHERETRPGRHLAPRRGPRAQGSRPLATGGLSGSVLSVRTWRQAWGAVTGQAS